MCPDACCGRGSLRWHVQQFNWAGSWFPFASCRPVPLLRLQAPISCPALPQVALGILRRMGCSNIVTAEDGEAALEALHVRTSTLLVAVHHMALSCGWLAAAAM